MACGVTDKTFDKRVELLSKYLKDTLGWKKHDVINISVIERKKYSGKAGHSRCFNASYVVPDNELIHTARYFLSLREVIYKEENMVMYFTPNPRNADKMLQKLMINQIESPAHVMGKVMTRIVSLLQHPDQKAKHKDTSGWCDIDVDDRKAIPEVKEALTKVGLDYHEVKTFNGSHLLFKIPKGTNCGELMKTFEVLDEKYRPEGRESKVVSFTTDRLLPCPYTFQASHLVEVE